MSSCKSLLIDLRDGKGQIIWDRVASADMGALAANDLVSISGAVFDAMVEDFRIIKMDYWIGLTPAQAIVILDGPILVGVAAGQLDAAEVEEAKLILVVDG